MDWRSKCLPLRFKCQTFHPYLTMFAAWSLCALASSILATKLCTYFSDRLSSSFWEMTATSNAVENTPIRPVRAAIPNERRRSLVVLLSWTRGCDLLHHCKGFCERRETSFDRPAGLSLVTERFHQRFHWRDRSIIHHQGSFAPIQSNIPFAFFSISFALQNKTYSPRPQYVVGTISP